MLPSPRPSSPTAVSHGQAGGEEEEDEARRVSTEYKRLTEERDEAERQLKHIKRVSQMVIEEVSALQTQLEIEKSCRENAEALATKLNCENKKLKYLSLTSRPCLDELLPSISDCIALEEEAEPQDTSPDPYARYQQQVKDLQETVNALLDEKKQLVCQLKEQQRQVEELNARSEKDHSEMKELYRTIEQQNQTIKKFNRVSVMAAQEYEGLKEQLELEQNLRQKAECFAHEVRGERRGCGGGGAGCGGDYGGPSRGSPAHRLVLTLLLVALLVVVLTLVHEALSGA